MVFCIWKKDLIKLLKIYRLLARYNNRSDNLSNNLKLNEISIPFSISFSNFTAKLTQNQLQIVVEATYGLQPY